MRVVRWVVIHRINLVTGEKIVDAVIWALYVVFCANATRPFLCSAGHAIDSLCQQTPAPAIWFAMTPQLIIPSKMWVR